MTGRAACLCLQLGIFFPCQPRWNQRTVTDMSRLSFKAFCIENYAQHIGKPSTEVYDLFVREQLLGLLDSDYEDLHGMGLEYLMQFFDEYLKGGAA